MKIRYSPHCCRIGPLGSFIIIIIMIGGLVIGFVGLGTYVAVSTRTKTECLPIKYEGKIGLCQPSWFANTYPVTGYITVFYSVDGKN